MKVTIEKVQFEQSIQGQICCLEVNKNIMHFVVVQKSESKMYVIDLDHPEKVISLSIPQLGKDETVQKTWALTSNKSSGIVLMSSGGKFYQYNHQDNSLLLLKRLSKRQNFDVVTMQSIDEDTALIGTRQSRLYKYNFSTDKLSKLHQWSSHAVDGLSYDGSSLWAVVGSTISVFQDLANIDDLKVTTPPAMTESFDRCSSKAQLLQHKRYMENPNFHTFGWITKNGIVFGSLNDSPSDAKVLLNVELPIPLAEGSKNIVSDIFLSEYHLIMLTTQRQLIIVNQLNNKVVFQEDINLSTDEPLKGFKVDYTKNTFWLYSNNNVFEIVIKDEYMNAWKILLNSKEYEKVLKIDGLPAFQKEMVYSRYADSLLEQNDISKAADIYSNVDSDISFTALRLMETGDVESFQTFLLKRLNNFEMTKMQQKIYTSLILWNYIQLKSSDRAIREFLIKNLNKLDRKLTYEILKYEKTTSNLLFYANLIKDYKTVLNYWIKLENWYEASKMLLLLNDEQYVYQYATVLLCNDPETTVQTWMKLCTSTQIYPEKLIKPILCFFSNCHMKTTSQENQGLQYLLWCVSNEQYIEAEYAKNTGSKYKSKIVTSLVHNTILYMMILDTKSDEELRIIEYMKHQNNKFDSNFVLSLSLKFNRIETAISLYSSLNLLEQAIDLAINSKMLETAKKIASFSKTVSSNNNHSGTLYAGSELPEGSGGRSFSDNGFKSNSMVDVSSTTLADDFSEEIALRRPLWIKIAKALLLGPMSRKNTKDTKQIITDLILESNGVLTIKDLLPLFDSMTTIANIKDELIKSLEQHAGSMKQISQEITNLVDIKKIILDQIEMLDKSFVKIKPGSLCDVCQTFLQSKKFYCFPCSHSFHINCLIKAVLQGGDLMLSASIQDLQRKRKPDWVKELDTLISSKCPLCSDININNIDEPMELSSNVDGNLLSL